MYLVGKKISKLKDFVFEDLINFDVFDNYFLLVYRSDNIIDVYTIEMYIYISYKMRLPLY